jgi:hypothetical protein
MKATGQTSPSRDTLADNESMSRVIDGDDLAKASMAEAKHHKALAVTPNARWWRARTNLSNGRAM